jgi:hypothetical protein
MINRGVREIDCFGNAATRQPDTLPKVTLIYYSDLFRWKI